MPGQTSYMSPSFDALPFSQNGLLVGPPFLMPVLDRFREFQVYLVKLLKLLTLLTLLLCLLSHPHELFVQMFHPIYWLQHSQEWYFHSNVFRILHPLKFNLFFNQNHIRKGKIHCWWSRILNNIISMLGVSLALSYCCFSLIWILDLILFHHKCVILYISKFVQKVFAQVIHPRYANLHPTYLHVSSKLSLE